MQIQSRWLGRVIRGPHHYNLVVGKETPLKEIKKIMAAVDFSEYSSGAMATAATLCRALGASLLLVNVINQRDVDMAKKVFYPIFGFTSFPCKIPRVQVSSSFGSTGNCTASPRLAERSMVFVIIRLRCPTAAVACGVVTPVWTRISQVFVSSRIGPQN